MSLPLQIKIVMLALVASIHAQRGGDVRFKKGVDPRDKREGDGWSWA